MSAKPPSTGSSPGKSPGKLPEKFPEKFNDTKGEHLPSHAPPSNLTHSSQYSPTTSSSAHRAGDPSMDVRLQILRFEAEAIKERAASATANEKMAEARVIELESKIRINLQRFEDYERRLQIAQADFANERKIRESANEDHRNQLDDLNQNIAQLRSALQIKQDEVDRLRLLNEALKRDIESIDQPKLSQLIAELTQALDSERDEHQNTRARNTQIQDELTQKLSELTVMKGKFLSALDQRQTEKETLETQINQLQSQISLLENEKLELLKVIQGHESENAHLKNELTQSETRAADLADKVQKTKAELEDAFAHSQELEEQKAELIRALKALETEDQELRNKAFQTQTKNVTFSEKIEELRQELQKSENAISLVEQDKAQLVRLLREQEEQELELKNQLNQQRAKVSSYEEKVGLLTSEIEKFKDTVKKTEGENQELSSKNQGLQSELIQAQTHNEFLVKKVEDCKTEIAQSQINLDKQREFLELECARTAELTRSYAQLEVLLEQFKQEKEHNSEQTEKRLAQAAQEIQLERERQQEVQGVIQSQLAEIKLYQEKIHQQEMQAVHLNNELGARQERALELAGLLDQSRQKFDEVNQQLDIYKSELERERGLKATLESRHQNLDNEIKRLYSEKEAVYKHSVEKVERERAQNLELIARCESLEAESFEANSRIETLEKELVGEKSQSSARIWELNEQTSTLKQQLSQVNEQISRMNEVVQIKQDEVERLRHLNEALKRDIESIDQPGLNQAIAELHATLEAEKEEHANTQSRNIELQDSLSRRLTEIGLIKAKLEGCSESREEDEKKYLQEIEKLNNEIDQLSMDKEELAKYELISHELRHKVADKDRQITDLQSQIEKTTHEYQTQISVKEQEVAALEQELGALRVKIQEIPVLEKKQHELIAELERLKTHSSADLQAQQSEIIDLQKQLELSIESSQERLLEAQESKKKVSTLEAELVVKSEKLIELKAQMEKVQSQHESAIEALKAEIEKSHQQELIIAQIKTELTHREQKITELNEELEENQNKLDSAQEELQDSRQELARHSRFQVELESQRKFLEQEVQHLSAEIARIENESAEALSEERAKSKSLDSQVQILRGENTVIVQLDGKIQELQQELSQVGSQLASVNELLQMKQEEADRLRYLNESLKRDIQAIDQTGMLQRISDLQISLETEKSEQSVNRNRIIELQDSLSRRMSEITLIKAKLDNCAESRDQEGKKHSDEIEQLNNQIDQLTLENEKIREFEKHSVELKLELLQLEAEKRELSTHIQNGKVQIQELAEEVELLRTQVAEIPALKSRQAELMENIKYHQNRLDAEGVEKKAEIKELNKTISTLRAECEKIIGLEKQAYERELELKSKEEKLGELKSALVSQEQDYARANQALQIEVAALRLENKKIHEQELVIAQVRAELSVREKNVQELSEDLEEIQKRLTTSQNQSATYGVELERFKVEQTSLLQKELELKKVIELLSQEKEALTRASYQSEKTQLELTQQNERSQAKILDLEDKIQEIGRELSEVSGQLSRVNELVALKQEEAERLRHLNESLKRDIEAIDQAGLLQRISDLQLLLETEKSERSNHHDRIIELQDSLSRRMSEISLIKAKLDNCAESRDQEGKNFSEEVEKLNNQIDQLTLENEKIREFERLSAELKLELVQKEREIVTLQQKIETENRAHTLVVDAGQAKVAELSKEIDKLRTQASEIPALKARQIELIDTIKYHQNRLDAESVEHKAEIKEFQKIIDSLRSECKKISELEREALENEYELKSKEEALAELKADLDQQALTHEQLVTSLRVEIEGLRVENKKIHEQELAIAQLRTELALREESARGLQEDLRHQRNALSKSDKERSELAQQNEQSRSKILQLEDQLQDVERERSEISEQLDRVNELVSLKQEESDRLRHLNESLKRDIQTIDQPKLLETIQSLTQAVEDERNEHARSQARLNEFQDSVTRQLSEISLLKAKLSSCSEQRESDVSELQKQLEAKSQELARQFKQDQSEIASLNHQIERLRTELTEVPILKNRQSELLHEIQRGEEKIKYHQNRLDAELVQHKAEIKELQKTIDALRSECQKIVELEKQAFESELELKAKEEKLQELRGRLSQEQAQSAQSIVALRAEIEALRLENKKIHEQELVIAQVRTELASSEKNSRSLQDGLSEAHHKLDSAMKQSAGYGIELERYKNEQAILLKREQQLEQQIERLNREKNEAGRLNAEQQIASRELAMQNDQSRQKIQALEGKISEQDQELTEMSAQLGRVNELVALKQEEADRLRHLNESLKRDIESIDQPKLNDTIQALSQALEGERSELSQAQSRVNEFQDQITRQLSEISLLKAKLASCSSQSEENKKRSEDEVSQLRSEIEKLGLKLERFNQQELEMFQVKNELKGSSARVLELEGFLEKSRERLGELTESLDRNRAELSSEIQIKLALEKQISYLESEIKRLERENAELVKGARQALESHRQECEEYEKRCADYEALLHQQEIVVLQLKNDVSNRSERVSLVSESLKETREKLEQTLKNLDTQSSALIQERQLSSEFRDRSALLDEKLKALVAEKQEAFQQYMAQLQEERAKFTEIMNRCGRLETVVDRLTQEKTTVSIEGEQRLQALSQELVQERAAHKTRVHELTEKITDLDQEIQDLKSQIERSNEVVQLKQEEVERLRHLNEAFKRDIDAINQPLLAKTIQDLNLSLSAERAELESTRARQIQLQDNLGKALSELSLQKAKSESAESHLTEISQEVSELVELKESLTEKVRSQEALIANLKTELDEEVSNRDLKIVRSEERAMLNETLLTETKAKLDQATALLEKTKQAETELRAKAISLENQIEKLRTEKVSLIREGELRFKVFQEEEKSQSNLRAQQLQNQLDSLKKDLDQTSLQLAKVQEEAAQYKQQTYGHAHQQELNLSMLRSEIVQLKADLQSQSAEIASRAKELSVLEVALLQERKLKEGALEQLYASKSSATSKMHEQEIAVITLRNEIQQRERDIGALKDTIISREARMNELQLEMQEIRDRLKLAEDGTDQERRLLEEQRSVNESVIAQIARVESSLKMKNEEVEKLRHLNEALRRDIEASNIDQLKQTIQEQAEELEQERRKSAEIAKLCADLQESIARQRSEVGLLQNSLTSVLENARNERPVDGPEMQNFLDEAMHNLVTQKAQLEQELGQASNSKKQAKKTKTTSTTRTNPSPIQKKKRNEVGI